MVKNNSETVTRKIMKENIMNEEKVSNIETRIKGKEKRGGKEDEKETGKEENE